MIITQAPRGFDSLPTQEVGYSFSGFIATNKQANKQTKSRSDPDSKHKTETDVTFLLSRKYFLDFISF